MHTCRSATLGLYSCPNETLMSLMNSGHLVDGYLGHWSTSGLHMPMSFNNKSLFEALYDLMYIQL